MQDIMYPLRLMKYEAEKLGINFLAHYGVRAFHYNGNVFGITTNDQWNDFTYNKESIYHTKHHYYDELNFIINNNAKYILRSEGLVNNDFLSKLSEVRMGNGIGIYQSNKSGIVGYYFTANQNIKDAMNFCINKIHLFERIANLVETQLVKKDYWNTAPILPSHKKLLLLNTRQLFFNEEIKDKGLSNKIFYNGENFIFTQREMQILDLIKITYKSKDLAQILNISTRTAEWYLYKLKRKVNVHNKDEWKRNIIGV